MHWFFVLWDYSISCNSIEQEAANSAMMGAAYQAKHVLLQNECKFDEITRCLPEPTLVCRPYDDADSVSSSNI